MAKEKQQVFFARLREQLGGPHANSRGITKERITDVLRRIDRHGPNAVDSVFALLDDQLDSVIGPLSKTHRFSHGATTDQIACHVGILQRGEAKLDREGRDAWIKPLRELDSQPATLIHIKALAYRLTRDSGERSRPRRRMPDTSGPSPNSVATPA